MTTTNVRLKWPRLRLFDPSSERVVTGTTSSSQACDKSKMLFHNRDRRADSVIQQTRTLSRYETSARSHLESNRARRLTPSDPRYPLRTRNRATAIASPPTFLEIVSPPSTTPPPRASPRSPPTPPPAPSPCTSRPPPCTSRGTTPSPPPPCPRPRRRSRRLPRSPPRSPRPRP